MLTLKELTQDEFDKWFAISTHRQAEDRAGVSGRSISDELKEVEAMIPQLLPDGKDTTGHVFRLARDVSEQAVAFVWVGVLPGMPEAARFLFDIYVIPEARRKGHGREVLETMMENLRCESVDEIHLNVLSNNQGAIALYEELGFATTRRGDDDKHLEMKKQLWTLSPAAPVENSWVPSMD